jgi:ATP-dependent 26S proteasome regulatory subunit
MEIGLPSETGRFQIFIIHTARMRDNKRMAADVDLQVQYKKVRLTVSRLIVKLLIGRNWQC